ncbi:MULTISPECIES: hypothetical protein [Brucella]|nr:MULTISPECIES: hypothetical protein [Brucella/Ochrobactrum group]KAB2694686.1 hypothetical protein F9K72_09525 [Brucella intermedia]MCO7735799.1 hypothetical protein [Brucella intermedia]MDL2205249.1 hypothetical protein [Brucella intermedia]NVM42915.1 hypothetical protein [Brucella intermedia]UXO84820.1 hypothetical protein N8I72_19920 [Brucella intermedia]
MSGSVVVRKIDPFWRDYHFIWKKPESWMPLLASWLAPRLRKDGMRRLRPGVYRDISWDDPEWSDILCRSLRGDFDDHAEELADSLELAVMRTFHGCRTADAGVYFREGLRLHDRREMTDRLRSIVAENAELHWMGDRVEETIREVNNTLDEGRLFVVADDMALLKHAAHYLIYGSEWITAVLGHSGHRVLRTIGTPTLLEIDLPLSMSSFRTRTELAVKMLDEWTRFTCNASDWSAPIDFSFLLRSAIPASCVVGRSHPPELRDPLNGKTLYRSSRITCAYCVQNEPNRGTL